MSIILTHVCANRLTCAETLEAFLRRLQGFRMISCYMALQRFRRKGWAALRRFQGGRGGGVRESKESVRPSQSCRLHFSVIEPWLILSRFAVFTEVNLVPSAPPALANVEWFSYTYIILRAYPLRGEKKVVFL